jgi:hypothetical protein
MPWFLKIVKTAPLFVGGFVRNPSSKKELFYVLPSGE